MAERRHTIGEGRGQRLRQTDNGGRIGSHLDQNRDKRHAKQEEDKAERGDGQMGHDAGEEGRGDVGLSKVQVSLCFWPKSTKVVGCQDACTGRGQEDGLPGTECLGLLR